MKRKKEILLVFFTLVVFIYILDPISAMRALSISVCRVPEVNGVCCEQYLSCEQFDWGACFGGMPIEGFDCICYYADLNNDGTVNIVDIAIVAKTFGSNLGDPKWNPIYDLNKDGTVNIIDVVIVAKEFGKSC